MIVCLAYHIMFISFFFAKKYIKRGAKKQMEKEKISMKGGKYPQDFQEKLMTLSLNADIMSSMVLKNKSLILFRTQSTKGKRRKQKFIWSLLEYSIL